MKLGAFSISLNVADLAASKQFYQKLGFSQVGGDDDQGWAILRNGDCTLGLFHGMIGANTLTFNPGWDQQGRALETFEDIRAIQACLKSDGLEFTTEADGASDGPASFLLNDPDGNPVLVDQHVPKPAT